MPGIGGPFVLVLLEIGKTSFSGFVVRTLQHAGPMQGRHSALRSVMHAVAGEPEQQGPAADCVVQHGALRWRELRFHLSRLRSVFGFMVCSRGGVDGEGAVAIRMVFMKQGQSVLDGVHHGGQRQRQRLRCPVCRNRQFALNRTLRARRPGRLAAGPAVPGYARRADSGIVGTRRPAWPCPSIRGADGFCCTPAAPAVQ